MRTPTLAAGATIGEHRIELRHHGPNNGRGAVSMRLQPAGALHVVDWIVVGRMPYRDLPGYDVHGIIRSTREALYDAVIDGMLAGKTLEELQAEIALPTFADLPMYEEWLPLNVAGVHRVLMDMSDFGLREDVAP